MGGKILVVDDDKKTVDLIRLYLEREGYWVVAAYNGKQALDLARRKRFDLVVLDLMLPEMDGLDVCRALREESDIPIVMLTARTTEEDMLLGLGLGADDYIPKPFSPRTLVARVQAVLRRTGNVDIAAPAQIQIGDLEMDYLRHEVRVKKQPVNLTPKEFKVLEILIREPGRVFSRGELLENAFGFSYEGLERTVDVHIMNLRRKIEANPARPTYIETVYGVGYRLADIHHVT
jgi:DNA-binding response OmpR family regulator